MKSTEGMKSRATQFWSPLPIPSQIQLFTFDFKIFIKPKCVVTENWYLTSGKPKHTTNCYQLYTAFRVVHPGFRPTSLWKILCGNCVGSSGAISMGRSSNGKACLPHFEWGDLKSTCTLCWAGKKKSFQVPNNAYHRHKRAIAFFEL